MMAVAVTSAALITIGYFDSSWWASLTLTLKGVIQDALVAVLSDFFKMLLRTKTGC